MVKKVTKTEILSEFRNIDGENFDLKITKRDKTIIVSLDRKFRSSFWISVAFLALLVLTILPLFIDSATICLLIIFVITSIYSFCSFVQAESLIMVEPLGYQVTTKYKVGQKDSFIPNNNVQSIFINEVILRNKVIHVLTLLTKENDKQILIPLFSNVKPRLQCLEIICKHLRDVSS